MNKKGCWVGPKTSKPLQPHQIIDPRPPIYTKKGKELIFFMDDEEHIVSNNDCCSNFGKKCKCGGIMHFQPVYGGIFYRCDRCGKYL